jgi:carbon storage regulator
MLVLSRKVGERIFINDGEIVITVVGMQGNQAKLGIAAPNDTPIHREEIFNKINADGRQNKLKGVKDE